MTWHFIRDWVLNISVQYGVDPVVFAVIYFGAIPFLMLSAAWLTRCIRAGKSTVLPLITGSCFLVSTYVYVLIAGRNIPLWVYALMTAAFVGGVAWSIFRVRREAPEG